MSENIHLDEHQVRLQKLTQLKEAWVIPYANKFDKQQSTTDLVKISQDESVLQDIDQLMQDGATQKYSTAWRLMMFRSHGKLSFGTIRDDVWDIQISFVRWKCQFNTWKTVVDAINIAGSDITSYKFVEKFFDIGDFIGVKGDLFVTKHGELTLFVDEYQMLSKALRPLGDKWHGIKDEEALYRQRYLDMTMNQDSYDRFVLKSNIVKEVRKFYRSEWFHEIETSVLGNSASGTAAQPFVTHHNAYDLDVYLRVATEPQNKMATVWRFEKVFEIGKDFRNEWIDPTHLQEFTMIEHYAVYWNYEDNMKFTEDLFDHLFKTLEIPFVRKVKNKAGEVKAVDFTTPWQRIDYIAQIKKDCGIDVSEYWADDEKELRELIRRQWHEWQWLDVQATATMIDYLYKKVTRPQILWPAFIYNYPKTMQPLARRNDENTGIVEQFQMIVNWVEILKAYSELVDPVEQQSNFDEQKEAQERWDEETTAADHDFVLSMEHGMPPQSWWGMGIERLCAILMEQDNLRDVTMFPLMKPLQEKSENTTNDISSTSAYQWNTEIDVMKVEWLIDTYLTDTKLHCQQVGFVMKAFAKQLWEDDILRHTVWILHDIDRDHIGKVATNHLWEEFDGIMDQLSADEHLRRAIKSHYPEGTWVQPGNLLEKYLISVDELTGFLYAYARMRPEWYNWMKRKSINKKIKDKQFAAWVDRDHLRNCEEYLWIPLTEFALSVAVLCNHQKFPTV